MNNDSSSGLSKLLGSGVFVSMLAILGLLWGIYIFYEEGKTTQEALDNQASQIAQSETQIALLAMQSQLSSEQATFDAQRENFQTQLLTPLPTNAIDYAPTASAIAQQSLQFEATSQAIQSQQRQVEESQTRVAQLQLTQSALSTTAVIQPSLTNTAPTVQPSPTSVATPVQSGFFTVDEANKVEIDNSCNYWTRPLAIYSAGTGTNKNETISWDLTTLPSGVLIGDAVVAEIDGYTLGNNGVTFRVQLGIYSELRLRDGVFFIISPENADGFLRLRVRNLECRGIDQEIVYLP